MDRLIYAYYFPIEDGWWGGRVIGMPEVITQGETLAACKENVRDAVRMLCEEDCDLPPSSPAWPKPVVEPIRVVTR